MKKHTMFVATAILAICALGAGDAYAANKDGACRIAHGQSNPSRVIDDGLVKRLVSTDWVGNISYRDESTGQITYDARGGWAAELSRFRPRTDGIWLYVRIGEVPRGGYSPKGGYRGTTRWTPRQGGYLQSQHGDVVYWLEGSRLHGVIADPRSGQCFPMIFEPAS